MGTDTTTPGCWFGGRVTLLPVVAQGTSSGTLRAIEFSALPFSPRRCFSVTPAAAGVTRGRHAHREQTLALWCQAGRVTVNLHLQGERATVELTPDSGLLVIEPGVCACQTYSSADSLLTVLCSGPYDPDEYLPGCCCDAGSR